MPIFLSRREKLLWFLAGAYSLLIYATLGLVRQVTNALRDRGLLRTTVAAAFAVAAIAVLSHLVRRRAPRRVWLALPLVALGYALVYRFAVVAPEERVHLIQYGLLALLIFLALGARAAASPAPASLLRRSVTAFLLTAALGWLDEIFQGLHPARVYDLRDVGLNAIAAALALTALAVLEVTTRPPSPPRPEPGASSTAPSPGSPPPGRP
jgi:VanZ family protein